MWTAIIGATVAFFKTIIVALCVYEKGIGIRFKNFIECFAFLFVFPVFSGDFAYFFAMASFFFEMNPDFKSEIFFASKILVLVDFILLGSLTLAILVFFAMEIVKCFNKKSEVELEDSKAEIELEDAKEECLSPMENAVQV